MNDKEMMEYTQWMLAGVGKMVVQAGIIYTVLIGAYWVFIG